MTRCHRCGRPTEYIGTSPSGAELFRCPESRCQHIQLMAVSERDVLPSDRARTNDRERWRYQG